jgi:hypothetical protein
MRFIDHPAVYAGGVCSGPLSCFAPVLHLLRMRGPAAILGNAEIIVNAVEGQTGSAHAHVGEKVCKLRQRAQTVIRAP